MIAMSALPPKARVRCKRDVRFGPKADNCLFIREPRRRAKEKRLELKVRGSLTLTGKCYFKILATS